MKPVDEFFIRMFGRNPGDPVAQAYSFNSRDMTHFAESYAKEIAKNSVHIQHGGARTVGKSIAMFTMRLHSINPKLAKEFTSYLFPDSDGDKKHPIGHYEDLNGKPIWVMPDGEEKEYTHQDGDYSKMCSSEFCRCKQ